MSGVQDPGLKVGPGPIRVSRHPGAHPMSPMEEDEAGRDVDLWRNVPRQFEGGTCDIFGR